MNQIDWFEILHYVPEPLNDGLFYIPDKHHRPVTNLILSLARISCLLPVSTSCQLSGE